MHAEPRPGRLANGGFHTQGYLVVLADNTGHRAVPIWLRDAGDLSNLLERPADQVITAAVPQELTTRLLGAARARVTGVDIDVTEAGAGELSPEVTVARIGLAGPAGPRQVTAKLGLSLALAAAAGAPVRLADAVMDRLAVPVPGDDLLTPFLDRVPPAAWPGGTDRADGDHGGYGIGPGHGPSGWPLAALPGPRPRYEPRNLDFADGLDRWDLDSWSGPGPDQPGAADGEPDYTAVAEGPSAVLSSAVPRPAGSAALVQAIYADDYRGATVTFSGEIRVGLLAGQAGLRLEILPHGRGMGRAREDHGRTTAGRRRAWTAYEITASIPADADLIRFGIALTGPGRIALRNPDLHIAEPACGAP
jgi:bifunctional DNase/RNase